LSEAELLLSHGHPARALALAHTAREEAAKVNLIGDVLEGAFPWAHFDAVFRDHSCKYAYLNRTVTYSDPTGVDATVSYVRSLGSPEFEQRQRALFVDLAAGAVLEPNAFTRADAAAVIQAGRDELQALNTQLFLTGGTGVRSGMAGLPTVQSPARRGPRRPGKAF
jgi:AbiV family abortive infection protein